MLLLYYGGKFLQKQLPWGPAYTRCRMRVCPIKIIFCKYRRTVANLEVRYREPESGSMKISPFDILEEHHMMNDQVMC